MRRKHRFLSLSLIPGLLAAPLIVNGCATHRGYGERGEEGRYYDADHRDYHAWNGIEIQFYQRWEGEGHRDHRDFNQRNADEQKEYWNWRHSQPN
jgi:hypothetical protein